MTDPDLPTEASEARDGRRHRLLVKGHLSAWIVLALVGLALRPGILLPGRPFLGIALLLLGVALLVMLWRSPAGERRAANVLHVLSLACLLVVAAELALSFRTPRIEVTRYPYPFRMHGFAPGESADGNRFEASSNDAGMRGAAPIPAKDDARYRILVLGGSAIFGVGSPDDRTPPAYLERILNARLAQHPVPGIERVEVINGGMGWYNSTQELVWLVTELVLLEPDMVVVVDGYNDAHHTVVWGNRPPANEVTSDIVEGLYDTPGVLCERPSWTQALLGVVGASRILRKLDARAIVAPYELGLVRPAHVAVPALSRANEPLMQHRLLMNWVLMHRLGEAFGFRTAFALQPTIYSKDVLTREEEDWIGAMDYRDVMDSVWHALEDFVARRCVELGLVRFASDALIRPSRERLFTDYCHLVPAGNELMAQAIADAIAPLYEAGPRRPDWSGVRAGALGVDPTWRPAALGEEPAD